MKATGKKKSDFEHDLLALLREQTNVLKEHSEALKKISNTLSTLENHSLRDHDEHIDPYPDHHWTYEPAWRAVFETRFEKIKEQVEVWKGGMDANLVFIALFVTIVTAFQVPVSQNLSANPQDLTNAILANLTTVVSEIASLNGMRVPKSLLQPAPFVPARSDEIVTFFWYTSLILSVMTAILAVLGRQWVGQLTRTPEDKSYLRKSMRQKLRQGFADKLLRPLLDSLHSFLILSIILFVVGLLYQLWDLSLSTNAKILKVTSSLGTFLTFAVGIVLVLTVIHAVVYEESPFAIPLSAFVGNFLPGKWKQRFSLDVNMQDDRLDACSHLCRTVSLMTERLHLDYISSIPLYDYMEHETEDSGPDLLHRYAHLVMDVMIRLLESDSSSRTKMSIARHVNRLWLYKDVERLSVEDRIKTELSSDQLFDAFYAAYDDVSPVQGGFRTALLIGMQRSLGFKDRLGSFNTSIWNSPHRTTRFFASIFSMSFDEDLSEDKRVTTLIDSMMGDYLIIFKKDSGLFAEIMDQTKKVALVRLLISVVPGYQSSIVKRLTSKQTSEFLTAVCEVLHENTAYDKASSPRARQLFSVLYDILYYHHAKNISLPADMDVSGIAKAYVDYFDDDGDDWMVDCLLGYYSLMDEQLLSHQRGLRDFLLSVKKRYSEREVWSCISGFNVDIILLLAESTGLPADDETIDEPAICDSL